jgi:hypothetical protein
MGMLLKDYSKRIMAGDNGRERGLLDRAQRGAGPRLIGGRLAEQTDDR